MASAAEKLPNTKELQTAASHSLHSEETTPKAHLSVVEGSGSSEKAKHTLPEKNPYQSRLDLLALLESRRKPVSPSDVPIGYTLDIERTDAVLYRRARLVDVPGIDNKDAPLSRLEAYLEVEGEHGQMQLDTLSLDSLHNFSLSRVFTDAEVTAEFAQADAEAQAQREVQAGTYLQQQV